MSNLNFKYGSVDNLKNVELNSGCIYVTTDEKSMYVDLPVTKQVMVNGELQPQIQTERIRLGDFLEYDTLEAVQADQKNWSTQTLVYIKQGNILAKYGMFDEIDKDGKVVIGEDGKPKQILQWKRINDVDGLSVNVTTLTNELNGVKIQVGTNTTAIGANSAAIAAEKTRAEGAEQANSAAIAAEKARAEAAEQANANDIAAEKARAEGIEGSHATQIEANTKAIADEKTRAEAAEAANDTAIKAEKTRAEGVEGTHAAQIAANDTAIKAEKTRAEGVEGTHATQIAANTKAIADEKTRAEAAEGQLQDNIDALSTDINNKMQVANAMTFKGVLDGSALTQLPSTGVQAGDTYKVGVKGQYINTTTDTQYVGDLIIAKADQGETDKDSYAGGWWHISSGYEDDYAAKLHAVFDDKDLITPTIGLGGGANENRGRVTFESTSDSLAISATGSNDAESGVSTNLKLSFNLVWGTFDDNTSGDE